MQPIKFRSTNDLYEFLPKEELDIVLYLKEIILSCDDRIQEKLSYNVPFYKLKKNTCFIWPGSVPWGKTTFKGVKLGITYGTQFLPQDSFWEFSDRKYVADKIFSNTDIDEDLLKSYLYEAIEFDCK